MQFRMTIKTRRAAAAAIAILTLVLAACGSGEAGQVREGIDTAFESQVWVSGAGLNQTDATVWESRFEELCTSQTEEYASIAGRWVTEDSGLTIRDDGSLPTAEEAESYVELIAGSVCDN